MKTKLSYLSLIAFLLLVSCENTADTKSETVETSTTEKEKIEKEEEFFIDEHTSQNSLDWAGTYSGIEPCADCEGIKYMLTIDDGGNYELIFEYLGEDSPANTKNGEFIWKDGNTIQLDAFADGEGSNLFKVEENQVRHLDMQGNKIEGNLAEYYVLKKVEM